MPPSFVFQEMAAAENCPFPYVIWIRLMGGSFCFTSTRPDTDPSCIPVLLLYEWLAALHVPTDHLEQIQVAYIVLPQAPDPGPTISLNQPTAALLGESHKCSPREQMNRVHVDKNMYIL